MALPLIRNRGGRQFHDARGVAGTVITQSNTQDEYTLSIPGVLTVTFPQDQLDLLASSLGPDIVEIRTLSPGLRGASYLIDYTTATTPDPAALTRQQWIDAVQNLKADDINASGDATIGGSLTVVTGDITATAGDIVATAGDIVATAGGITATAGDITAIAGDVVATAGDLVATAGDVTASAGTVTGNALVATTSMTSASAIIGVSPNALHFTGAQYFRAGRSAGGLQALNAGDEGDWNDMTFTDDPFGLWDAGNAFLTAPGDGILWMQIRNVFTVAGVSVIGTNPVMDVQIWWSVNPGFGGGIEVGQDATPAAAGQRFVLFGTSGAGSNQAQAFVDAVGWRRVTTGDICRPRARNNSPTHSGNIIAVEYGQVGFFRQTALITGWFQPTL